MKFYLKKAVVGFVYLVFSAMASYGVLYIPGLAGLKVVLLILNLCLYLYVLSATAIQDGQSAYKIRMANDLNRKQIVLTGEDIPLDTQKEYKAYKGYIIGVVICLPLIVLLIIHSILMKTNPLNQDYGVAASVLYLSFYAFAGVNVKVGDLFAVVSPYWALVSIPVIILVQGFSFYLGGRKIELQQEMIRQRHKMIHGE